MVKHLPLLQPFESHQEPLAYLQGESIGRAINMPRMAAKRHNTHPHTSSPQNIEPIKRAKKVH